MGYSGVNPIHLGFLGPLSMTTSHQRRGYTLIELLVVIAIIGILSAVVLVALDVVRSKGRDTAVKENLTNLRAQGESFYDEEGGVAGAFGYGRECQDLTINDIQSLYPGVMGAVQAGGFTGFQNDATAAQAAVGPACNDDVAGWAVQVPITKGTAFFCVDSGGTATTTTENLIADETDIACY